ncbi:MAG: hypothetical protein LBO63_05335 [Oscillospiraceae bacterium]|jgi:flavodoxin|nr:hypothetical protein [Oscillospiraceae bacterium]
MAGKNLIVYYSRTGITELLATALQEKLGCDIDRVQYAERDKVSFAAAGFEAVRKTTVKIKGDTHDASDYNRIFIISPVWASSLATPVRSYLAANADKIKSYALLVTSGGSDVDGAERDAAAAAGKAPDASQQFLSADIKRGNFDLKSFTE